MHGKNQKGNLVHLYIHLVETFALIFNSKIVFQKPFWLKLLILKKYTTCTLSFNNSVATGHTC